MIAAINWITVPLRQFGWVSLITVRSFDFMMRAIVALVICYSAFLSEIFRAGIEAVSKGQVEAARALGLSSSQILRMIIMPQAVRVIFPPLGNQFISMVKDSSLVSVLGVQDVTQIANVYSAASYEFLATYNVLAFIYVAINICLSILLRTVERRIRVA
jgi:polar amino acid transport system permease protein